MERHFNLKDYLTCLAQIRRLQPEEEAQLENSLRRTQDRDARRLLEEAYLPRVLGWVSAYRGLGYEYETMIKMGNKALLRGLRRYHGAVPMGLMDYLEEKVRDEIEAALAAKA
jgi:DNA-directed RNA polymerase sigma subunit (sigma70/sigma32)